MSSDARKPAPHNNLSEPDVQVIEPPRATNNRSFYVPNDAEIIDIGTSSDDLGELVSRAIKSSSPDPVLLMSRKDVHVFETHPAEYSLSASNKGKGRAKEPSELVVEGSEGSDEIEEPMGRLSSTKRSPGIPKNIVRDRKMHFHSKPASAPASAPVQYPIDKMRQVALTTGTIISHMKKKDEVTRRTCVSHGVPSRVYFVITEAQASLIVLELLHLIS